MGTLAGTSRGVFTIGGDGVRHVLESTPVRDLTAVNGRVFAGTEAGLFQNGGYSACICGPGNIEQAHQPDEWIAIDQLERGARFMQNLARELA